MNVWDAIQPSAGGRLLPTRTTHAAVVQALQLSFRELGRDDNDLARRVLDVTGSSRVAVETAAKSIVSTQVDMAAIDRALNRRARTVAKQVLDYLSPHIWRSAVDIGCGDGMISLLLRDHAERWTLCDTAEYLASQVALPFVLLKPGALLPFGTDEFDLSLLLTVLHHADDGSQLLRESLRVTKTACVIIESVFGSTERMPTDPVGLSSLDESEQWVYAAFVDWFYNRVLHDDVPVPCGFRTPEQWRRSFDELGWSVTTEIDLGIDQPLVPEHHVLFVIRPAS